MLSIILHSISEMLFILSGKITLKTRSSAAMEELDGRGVDVIFLGAGWEGAILRCNSFP